MLEVSNPTLPLIGGYIVNEYPEFLDTDRMKEYGWNSWYETEPHITLVYDLEPIGKYSLINLIRMKFREEYLSLKSCPVLHIDALPINEFDCGDYYVLKVSFDQCKEYDKLEAYAKRFRELPNNWRYGNPYHPHCTITYLKKEAPINRIIDDLHERFEESLRIFQVGDFIISSQDESVPQLRVKLNGYGA